MDDNRRELNNQPSLESSLPPGLSPLRQNEQANKEMQFVWSSYRKHTPSPDSDRDSDASEGTSDGSVQWEKNFIDKLVKVNKRSCQHQKASDSDRTTPANEDLKRCLVKQELALSCETNPDNKGGNDQLQESEKLLYDSNQDVKSSPEKHKLSVSHESSLHGECSNWQREVLSLQVLSHNGESRSCQLSSCEEATPKFSEDIIRPPANSQVSSSCGNGSMKVHNMSSLYEDENAKQELQYENHELGDVNKPCVSGVMEQQPGCSKNCIVSSSCDSNQFQGLKQLKSDIETELHTYDGLNLGYVSRWMKKPPESPRNCEVTSSSCDSESDDGCTGPHEWERERQNQGAYQQGQPNPDFFVAGAAKESETIVKSPYNCPVSSSCESDSGASGYSNLCLRMSEDSVEDETDGSSGKERRNKSCETLTDTKDGEHSHINMQHTQSGESVRSYVYDAVPTQTSSLSPHIKRKRSRSHQELLTNCSHSRRHQQWTRHSPNRDRPARLRSQSPTDRVGRWRRSQSPVADCRKLRSRSVLSIRDAQHVPYRGRRSKSCDTYSKHKKSCEGQEPSKKHLPLQRTASVESISEASSTNRVKRRSRSSRRRWSKHASSSGRHKSSSSSRGESILQMTDSNSNSLSVTTSASGIHSSNIHKFQEGHTVSESECDHLARSHVKQTHLSKSKNPPEQQLTFRNQCSVSRRRSVSSEAQQEFVDENMSTRIRHSMSGVHIHSNEKEETLEGSKGYMRRQSVFLSTSKRNGRRRKKKNSPEEHLTPASGDTVIQNTPLEQPAFGKKPSGAITRHKSTEETNKNKELAGEQLSFSDICSITEGSSTRFLHSYPENAFGKITRSHRSQELPEEWFTSTSRHSAPVTTFRRQSRLNKCQEMQHQSTISNTYASLKMSSKDVHSSKDNKLSDDHVAFVSSCLTSGSTAERHAKSNDNEEMAGNNLCSTEFKGFSGEEISLNSNPSLSIVIPARSAFPISTLAQVHSASKTRHSVSVLTRGTLSLLNKVKMASELHGSSDVKRLSHHLSTKRKLSNELYQSGGEPVTSKNIPPYLTRSCAKQTDSSKTRGKRVEKYSSNNRYSLLRSSCVGCGNLEQQCKINVFGKFKQSSEVAQHMLQPKQVELSKKTFHHHQTETSSSHLQSGHSSEVNGHVATNKTPHTERCDKGSAPKRLRLSDMYSPLSKKKTDAKISKRKNSILKDTSTVCEASDDTMVKCSLRDRTCFKEDDALLGPNRSVIKQCSVVLKNIVLSSVYDKYVNKYENFLFPHFPHVVTPKVSDFCLPQEYLKTVGTKGK